MSSILEDTLLGKIIFTDKALSKMSQYGLYPFEISDTLKHGFDVKPLIPGTHQKQYLHSQQKQIGVIFKTEDKNNEAIGGILIISCWSKTIV